MRIIAAVVYWCFVMAMFFQHWGAERLPVIIFTLPWSAIALTWGFLLALLLQAFAPNLPEPSNTIISILHFTILVVFCGGLNAALIADFLTVRRGRFPSNFHFHRPREKK